MEDIRPADAGARSPAFWVGVLALFTAGISAALRAAIAADLKTEYLDGIDLATSATMIGVALGSAFLGFSIMLFVSSLLLDKIGMRRMLLVASVAFVVSAGVVIFCGSFGGGRTVYHAIVAGMFLAGVGWGAVEGTINPMVASLYPKDTTHWMNMLHAWWPAGLIVGGLTGVAGAQMGLDWRVLYAIVPVLAVVFGLWTLRCSFPQTTSAQMGVATAGQFKEVLRRPSFLIWFGLMFLTAASELAPGQWVDVALTNVVGMRGVLLLVYVSGIMFVGRHFAGPIANRLSPEGLLCLSCVLAAIGLYGLSIANSPVTAMLAATAWGLGVCYLWPTMLAVAAERYPRGGALTIGLMGVAGALSTYFVLPALGAVYDQAKLEAAGGASALAAMTPEQLQPVLVFAAGQSFRAVSIIPVFLVIAFGALWVVHRRGRSSAPAAAVS